MESYWRKNLKCNNIGRDKMFVHFMWMIVFKKIAETVMNSNFNQSFKSST